MVAVKPAEADAALARIDPRVALVLVYGPDTGLVAERAKRAARAAVEDPEDPFQFVKLDGDGVAADPGKLADEAGTVAMFGGRRAVWVRPTSKNLVPAVEAVLSLPGSDALVVIEAGDLAKSAPLRTLCEKAPRALAIPCYADEGRNLSQVVDEVLREAGLAIDRDTRTLLVESLGGDRLATRSELDKLVLYCHGQTNVTQADLEAVLSDVSGLQATAVTDAAFAGSVREADEALRRLRQEGTSVTGILTPLLGHATTLLPLTLDVASGSPPAVAVEAWRGLHFKRKPLVTKHLGLWTPDLLRRLVGRIQETVLATRRAADLADELTEKLVVDIARMAAARASRRG
ncbi:DNA polymerase III subunit delta [Salinarimonas ramus]|uniref:DNA-directed DNA polymerase n=1 Tax=Salinarimonas ramus TaxID=690164 RepID=A0A917Q8J0_9HYPH|nr:DNA polymerase III subunit delta [Salinarimonas ramus]GGK34517.1 DNA polymerase III subunit delta [Salinarimonas ramus]